MKKLLLLSFALALGTSGCGGAGGGSAELATSFVTASAKTATLDSDVIAWVDATGAKATACANTSLPSTPAADSVDVEVISKAYSNITNGLPIRIERAIITYTPANSSTPTAQPEYQTIGTTLTNGSTGPVPIRVVTQERKIALQNKLGCSNTIYHYAVNIALEISELGSGKSETVNTSVDVRISDFVDK